MGVQADRKTSHVKVVGVQITIKHLDWNRASLEQEIPLDVSNSGPIARLIPWQFNSPIPQNPEYKNAYEHLLGLLVIERLVQLTQTVGAVKDLPQVLTEFAHVSSIDIDESRPPSQLEDRVLYGSEQATPGASRQLRKTIGINIVGMNVVRARQQRLGEGSNKTFIRHRFEIC